MKLNYPSITQYQQLVQLKDYRAHTKKEYVRYVCKLAEHFQCDPENQVREYFLFLRQHKHYGGSAMNLAKCALRCFFRESVKVEKWTIFEEVRITRPDVLPIVLSRQEVQRVLAAVRDLGSVDDNARKFFISPGWLASVLPQRAWSCRVREPGAHVAPPKTIQQPSRRGILDPLLASVRTLRDSSRDLSKR